jgi:hypothetical protein
MPTVTIGGNDYASYVDLADAQVYLAAQVTATDWAAATPDQQSAALVSMSRTLDRQPWLGTQTDDYETHAWPRSGLFYADGITPVDPNTVPDAIVNATCEGAAQLLAGVQIEDEATTFNFTKSLKAGSVEIVNFRQVDPAPRFPQVVQELIGLWLGGQFTLQGSKSSGTRGRSIMEEQYDVRRGF